ncbi:MAG: beta-hydroxyacyl-ACP dehydratase [Verrucomicrobia bacterium]|nr:beta-hydroxyacyl-ACP dehydratase [Verrucomicrobiota bacterium]
MNSELLHSALLRLPHGPEFRFVDRMTELDPGVSGTGEYVLHGNEPFLKGHFPNEPLMPGVLMIEAAAQVAGVVAQSMPGVAPLKDLKLTAMRLVKIFGAVKPGEAIIIRATVSGRLGGLVQASVEVSHGDQKLLTAELTLSGH